MAALGLVFTPCFTSERGSTGSDALSGFPFHPAINGERERGLIEQRQGLSVCSLTHQQYGRSRKRGPRPP